MRKAAFIVAETAEAAETGSAKWSTLKNRTNIPFKEGTRRIDNCQSTGGCRGG